MRTVQWSVALQREVVRNLVVEAAYVANRSVWAQSNISQINVVTNQIANATTLRVFAAGTIVSAR